MTVVISHGLAVRVSPSPMAAMREAVVDIRRQLEDARWLPVGTTSDRLQGLEDAPGERRDVVQRVRRMRRKNPLAKRGAQLLQDYVFGQGVSLRPNNKAMVARIVDEFWENPVNEAVFTSVGAMRRVADRVFTDGEHFLLLFPDEEEGTLELGRIDCQLVDDPITDPDNDAIVRWWKVRLPIKKFDWSTGEWDLQTSDDVVYYRHWTNDRTDFGPPASKVRDGLVYHLAINVQAHRGESELAAALDWVNAHRRFMEDRATLNRAAAMFAWKKKRKGGAADIAAEVTRLQSSIATGGLGGGVERNPPGATGSTLVENEASTTEWVKTDTGGQAASADERTLRMMAGSGMGGIPNHYYGDEANANLATATSMELPLLKNYEDWQTMFAGAIRDLIDFALSTANKAERLGPRDDSRRYADHVTTPAKVLAADDAAQGEEGPVREAPFGVPAEPPAPRTEAEWVTAGATDKSGAVDWYVDVDFPPIVQKEITEHTTALKELYAVLPGQNIESQKLVVSLFLTMLGINDVDEVMAKVFPPDLYDRVAPGQPAASPDAIAKQVAALLGGKQPEPGQPAAAAPEADEDAVKEAFDTLAHARVLRLTRAATRAEDALARAG